MISRPEIETAFRSIRGVSELEWRTLPGGQAIVRLRFKWWAGFGLGAIHAQAYETARGYLDANEVYDVLVEVW